MEDVRLVTLKYLVNRRRVHSEHDNAFLLWSWSKVGTYRHLWDISANTEVTHEVSYLWSGTVAVGFSYMVNILGLQNGLSFSLSFSGTQTYAVAAHYMDSSKRIKFYENAQSANPAVDQVYSYVFWYSPA